jgi:hypothetical protein
MHNAADNDWAVGSEEPEVGGRRYIFPTAYFLSKMTALLGSTPLL